MNNNLIERTYLSALEKFRSHRWYDNFTLAQEKLIRATLAMHYASSSQYDGVIGVLPTGAGKSVCYQIPSLVVEGKTIVISPLVALISDQVYSLQERGVRAEWLTGDMSASCKERIISDYIRGDVDMLYVSPERFVKEWFMLDISRQTISAIVIDECHTLWESMWYRWCVRKVGEVIQELQSLQLQKIVVSAYTATATPHTINHVKQVLGMDNPYIYRDNTQKKNLQIFAKRCDDESKQREYVESIVDNSREMRGAKIIFCSTIKKLEKVQGWLESLWVNVGIYHGKLESEEKETNMSAFMSDNVDWLVATKAFGMWVDKPNIRIVLHVGMPSSVMSYTQEIGRAGRDGEDSMCGLLYTSADAMIARFFSTSGNLSSAENQININSHKRLIRILSGLDEDISYELAQHFVGLVAKQ